jgi:hypothetical protein
MTGEEVTLELPHSVYCELNRGGSLPELQLESADAVLCDLEHERGFLAQLDGLRIGGVEYFIVRDAADEELYIGCRLEGEVLEGFECATQLT